MSIDIRCIWTLRWIELWDVVLKIGLMCLIYAAGQVYVILSNYSFFGEDVQWRFWFHRSPSTHREGAKFLHLKENKGKKKNNYLI